MYTTYVQLTHRKVAAGEAERLGDLLPDCAEFVLAPYLGAAEASRLQGVCSMMESKSAL